jgi:hypothetical protein
MGHSRWGTMMTRCWKACGWLALTLWLGGCSTLRGDFHQSLQIDALDARNRPIEGMRCQVGSGTSAKKFVTPATDVRVRRGLEPLQIECRLDSLVATATVKSRRERMEEALLPFGSVGVFIDHLSGSLYAYPTTLHLRVGQHIVLEHGVEARIAEAEPVQPQPQSGSAVVQRTELAAVHPAAPVIASTTPAAAAQRKPVAPAPKAQRAATKPVKTTSVASNTSTTKPKTAPSKAAVAATAAAASTAAAVGTSAAVHSAPVNW